MKPIFYITIFLLFTAFSCENEEEAVFIELNKEFEVKWDREYIVHPGLSFSIEDLNDSRCPLGVECVWAGEATVTLKLSEEGTTQPDGTSSIQLKTTEPKVQSFNQYRFELIDVLHYPDINKEFKKKEIRVILKIKETGEQHEKHT